MSRNPDASRPLDKDKLYLIPRDDAVSAAHMSLHWLQGEDPEHQVAGVAVLFASVCNRCGVNPQDMHTLALRLLTHQGHHDKTNKALQSLRDFAGLRIAGQDVTIS